jgi:signal transduction histidine kinase
MREVDRLKSEFLASMSHELRTPLNSIIGYTEIMLMGIDAELDSETREDVQAIYDNSQHLLRIINDVLDLARIEAGRLELDMEEAPVEALIEAASKSVVGLLVDKPIEFHVEAENGESGLVMVRELKPPLVLLDIGLPGMDGLEVVGRIKADEELCDTFVIAITASAMRGDRERFLAAGCDDYMSKPIQAVSLIEKVASHYQ